MQYIPCSRERALGLCRCGAHEDLLQVGRHDLFELGSGGICLLDGLQEMVSQGGRCRVLLLTNGLLPSSTHMWFTTGNTSCMSPVCWTWERWHLNVKLSSHRTSVDHPPLTLMNWLPSAVPVGTQALGPSIGLAFGCGAWSESHPETVLGLVGRYFHRGC